MHHKPYLIPIVTFIAGFGIAALAFSGGTPHGMHRMPDGTMMHDDGMSMASMMADMNAALAGKTGSAFDEAFLQEMIVHHEGAVDMAKLVLEKSSRPELKTLATDIISAQEKEIAQMKGWLAAWY